MIDKLSNVKEILKKYNQEHLLYFYNEISDEQKELLLNQILSIDFEEILNLYKNSMQNDDLDINTVSPLPHFEKELFSEEEIRYLHKNR